MYFNIFLVKIDCHIYYFYFKRLGHVNSNESSNINTD